MKSKLSRFIVTLLLGSLLFPAVANAATTGYGAGTYGADGYGTTASGIGTLPATGTVGQWLLIGGAALIAIGVTWLVWQYQKRRQSPQA